MENSRKNSKLGSLIVLLCLLVVALALTVFFAIRMGDRQQESMEASAELMSQLRVVIDPGHGGEDPGTLGTNTGAQEAHINLEIAKRLQALLESKGAQVIMTRESGDPIAPSKDEDMALRRQIISESGQDLTISIHQNHFEDPSVKGPQVFYKNGSEEGASLASSIQTALNDGLSIKDPRYEQGSEFYIVKSGTAPAVIVECGFLSNPEEELLLQKSAYQIELVKAIYNGICDYLSLGDMRI